MAKRKKQTKKSVRRKILLKWHEYGDEYLIFYANGQYRSTKWNQSDYSDWKIKKGRFYYKHSYDNGFLRNNDEDDELLVEALDKALLDFSFEEQVLK